MSPGLSVPTDNIYKFYALFGLALMISSILAFVYVYDSNRAQVIQWAEEVQVIDKKENTTPSDADRRELLKVLIEVENSNMKFYNHVINIGFGVSIFLSVMGLFIWHLVVQPRSDRMLELQIKALELEIAVSQESLSPR